MTFSLRLFSGPGGDNSPRQRPVVHTDRAAHLTRQPDHADHTTLVRLRAGDEMVMTELFDRHFDTLTGFMTRIVGNTDMAAELAGDVFIRLWERRQTLEIRSTVAAYLFTAGRHLALNHIRDERGRERLLATYSDGQTAPGMAETPADADDSAERLDRMQQMMRAVRELPMTQRQATLLRWREELSYEAAAEVMGISPNAVKLHVSRALKTLRARLAGPREP